MNFTNMIPLSQATKSLSATQSGASDTSSSGTVSNIYDGNNGTNYMYYVHHGGDGDVTGVLDFIVTWPKARKIYSLYANGTAHMDGGDNFTARGSEFDFLVQLYYSGAWRDIVSSGAIYNGKAGDGASAYNWVQAPTGSWSGVTGARFYMHVFASSYEGNREQKGWLYMNEFACYREKYEEIFRIQKPSGVVRLGSNVLQPATDKVRAAKNGTIVGVPLVTTDDPDASPLRIYNGSSVMAFPLAD